MQRKVSDKTTLHFEDGKIIIATEEDLTDLVEANNELRKEPQDFRGQKHRVHVAEIPNHLMLELRKRFGPMKHNQKEWKRWLNDPDNWAFRTWHGTV